MPSTRTRRRIRYDGEGEPTAAEASSSTEIPKELSNKMKTFVSIVLGVNNTEGKFDQETLKAALSPDQKKTLINQILTQEPKFFNNKQEAYSFFDYKDVPKITKKIKEPIKDDTQKDILKDLKSILKATQDVSAATTTSASATPKKEKQILSPENLKLAISIKNIAENVDTNNEQSIQQKIERYNDLLTTIDEDEKYFSENYYTLLSSEIPTKFTSLQQFLGSDLEEFKDNIHKEITSLFTQQGKLNKYNTIKDYNTYLSNNIEPKVINEENKLKIKQDQVNTILQSDSIVFLVKLNDSLKLNNKYTTLYDSLLQINKISYFDSILNIPPLEIIKFETITMEKIPDLNLNDLSDSDKTAIQAQLDEVKNRAQSLIDRLNTVTETKTKIDEDMLTYYGYSYDAGVKLLNQMIHHKQDKEKKASKETSALLVDNLLTRSKTKKYNKIPKKTTITTTVKQPEAEDIKPVVEEEIETAPVFQGLGSTTPSPLPFLESVGKGQQNLRKTSPSSSSSSSKPSLFQQLKQGVSLKKTTQQEKPVPKSINAFQQALLNNPKFKTLGQQTTLTPEEEEGWLDGAKTKRSNKKNQPKKKSEQQQPRENIKKSCKNLAQQKIKINLHEFYHNKKFKSKKQALAVSFNQVRKKFPECIQYLQRKKSL